jgi:hypothetical protein
MTSSRYGEPIAPEPASGQLTFAELQRAVSAADPAAFLVLPRILRRVIKRDRRLAGFGLRAPHRKSYLIDSEPLLEIIDKADLGVADEFDLPERVILVTRPSTQDFLDRPSNTLFIRTWRLLFHARVHDVLDRKAASGDLIPAAIRQRIHEIGPARFDEIRTVLGQEDLLLPPQSDESTYVEFVATYLELRRFAPSFLPRYFPGLDDLDAVDELIGRDVDADRLFQATRPQGAADPIDSCELDPWAGLSTEQQFPAPTAPPAEIASETKYRVLMRASQRPASLGNVVRAAIYHARAERCAPPQFAGRVRSAVKMDVDRLIGRLQAALELEQRSPQPWQESLFALVSQTPRGIWTVEARLLYDLQKVCVDHERDIYTVDLVEWALSWGRRPVKRHLPSQRDVLMLKHLRSAARRLTVVRISDEQRRQLALLVHGAIERVESRLRQDLRPKIDAVLDEVQLTPQNPPERVARKKLVEELLDQVGDRGFLSMGDVRDAISRNNLKLPDISWRFEVLHGDQLLRADRKLALALDGVYRRGEIYLRWMQRLSSFGFGTRIGRFFTRFAVVPFGGAFVALAGLREAWELISGRKSAEGEFTLPWPEVMFPLGLFLLCLINSVIFRRAVGRFFLASFRLFRAVLVEPIRWIIRSPLLQAFINNRLFPLSFRYLIKPLIWVNIIRWLLPLKETSWQVSAGISASLFLAVNLALNSRAGRTFEEIVVDEAVQGWRRFGLRVIMGLFWLIVDVFRRIVQTVERLMYSVDEWLRFRSGASRASFVAKAVMGLLWFFVAYILRFAVNVLIEPQINPIKHFPVVTVGHKLLFFTIEPIAQQLSSSLQIGIFEARSVAASVIWCIPGIFGFLAWELQENWRLYAANRPQQLRPVHIGSHGETMARLLKPGFHSGTLPKRFAKLRRAERHARAGGNWRAVHRHVQALHRAELSIRRFVEREFLELFAESKCWQTPPLTLEQLRLGTNFVRLSLGCPEMADGPLQVAIESQSGWLLVDAAGSGWIDRLLPQQRQVLVTAILGLYKATGTDLVRRQIESEFPPPVPWYDVSAEGLVVWPDDQGDVEVLYDLHEGPWIAPQSVRGLPRRRLPTVERWRFVFAEIPLEWSRWVEVWNQDVAGQGHPRDAIIPVHVLPQ